MTDNELKKLSRTDLLELLLQQKKENVALRQQVAALEDQLAQRQLHIEEAGSIAEASLALNGVFEAAQAACDQYIENVRQMSRQQEEKCRRMEEAAQAKYDKMIADAKRISQNYWDEYAARFQNFASSYENLKKFAEMPKPNVQETDE